MLTQAELERRRHFVTATDAAPILGRSPWANAADVFYSKTQGLTFKTNEAMEIGSALEPAVLKLAERKLGPLSEGDWRVSDNGINACSLDAVTRFGEPVEAKTTGICGPGMPYEWGEDGSDEVPDYYNIQVQEQLFVTEQKRGWIPVLIGGRGFRLYEIFRNERIIEVIAQASVAFWNNHVLTGIPPEDVVPSMEVLKLMRRIPEKTVDLGDKLVAEFEAANELANRYTKLAEQAKAALIQSLGDADGGRYSTGLVTYYEQRRKDATFRVLKVKPNKSKAVLT